MAGMSITDERKQVISFAGPYATEPTMFATMKGSPLLALNLPTTAVDMATITPDEQKLIDQTAAAVKGKTIGVQVSTIQQNMVEQLMPGVEVRTYDKVDNLGLDLVSGRIDALVADVSAIDGLVKASDQNKDITKFGPAFSRGLLGEGVGRRRAQGRHRASGQARQGDQGCDGRRHHRQADDPVVRLGHLDQIRDVRVTIRRSAPVSRPCLTCSPGAIPAGATRWCAAR